MKLLAIDTSSAQCSVALLLGNGEPAHRAVLTARDHARLLLPMVDELLAAAGVSLRMLDGIAFGQGPGSFTGVRIAAAATQGLAAGAGLPVLGISSLRALAAQARDSLGPGAGSLPEGLLLACMDARMGEVYWGMFGPDLAAGEEAVGPPAALLARGFAPILAAAGKGLAAFPNIADSLQLPAARVLAGAEPHAVQVAVLAARDLLQGARWLDPAQAQPVYLRNEVVRTPQQGPAAGAVKCP